MLPDARKPSVAAIDGIALGGGLEVAMVCLGYLVGSWFSLFAALFLKTMW